MKGSTNEDRRITRMTLNGLIGETFSEKNDKLQNIQTKDTTLTFRQKMFEKCHRGATCMNVILNFHPICNLWLNLGFK